MKLALLTSMLGVAVVLSGCANRLSTTTQDPVDTVAAAANTSHSYVVVRTTSRPVTTITRPRPTTYPAPPPPASVRILRGPQTLPTARATVIRPRRTTARVQPALSAPVMPSTPRRAKAAPAPCMDQVLFTPQKDCVLDPCDPCAGGRCSVPR